VLPPPTSLLASLAVVNALYMGAPVMVWQLVAVLVVVVGVAVGVVAPAVHSAFLAIMADGKRRQ